MIPGRTLGQGATCEAKISSKFHKAVSLCILSEEDYNRSQDLFEDGNVLIIMDFGQVVASARPDEGHLPGMVFIPMSSGGSVLVGLGGHGCRMPRFKGIEAGAEDTEIAVKDVRELFRDLRWTKDHDSEDVLSPLSGDLCDAVRMNIMDDKIANFKRACRPAARKINALQRTVKPMDLAGGQFVETTPRRSIFGGGLSGSCRVPHRGEAIPSMFTGCPSRSSWAAW